MSTPLGFSQIPDIYSDVPIVEVVREVTLLDKQKRDQLSRFVGECVANPKILHASEDEHLYIDVLTAKQFEIALRPGTLTSAQAIKIIKLFKAQQSEARMDSVIEGGAVIGHDEYRFVCLGTTEQARSVLLEERNLLLGRIGIRDLAVSSPPIPVIAGEKEDRELVNSIFGKIKRLGLDGTPIIIGPPKLFIEDV